MICSDYYEKSYTSQYSEQIVLTLMKNINSVKLNKLEHSKLNQYIRNKLQDHDLDNQIENIKGKVFLKLLKCDLLKTDFSLQDSSLDEAKRIADKVIEKEIKEFRLKAEKTVEGQVARMLDSLRMLPLEKRCYSSSHNSRNKS
ncbi:MAG: hypothetical protein ACEY3M_04925 [Wolbachia sp.]